MEHDAWFFIGVFAFIFLIWIATGGPLHHIAFTGPRLALPGALGGGTYLSLPQATFETGKSSVSLPDPTTGTRYLNPTHAPVFVGGNVFGEISPYRDLVSLNHYVSGAGSTDPKNEYVQINVASNSGVPVDISEWVLKSDATGSATNIPKGTEVPLSGTINAAQDIVLSRGDRAMIISGASPIGASFRENKCIGYFGTFQSFYPSLPQNCPLPSTELETFYGADYIRDASCIDYVNTLSRCQVVLSPPVRLSGACQNFLVQHLNYNGCVAAHRTDADFKGNTWRIYLGRTSPLWRTKHELVKLIDINGKTVDAFTY